MKFINTTDLSSRCMMYTSITAVVLASLTSIFLYTSLGMAAKTTSQEKDETTRKDHPLSTITYNIHSCVGSDGKYSVARIAHVLKQANADIVFLQEVEVNSALQTTRIWSTEHRDDQPALLAKEAGYSYSRFAKAITCLTDKNTGIESFGEGQGEFGIAVLSKWPIQEHKILQFLPFSEKTPRNVLACGVLTPAGKVWAVNTHLGCHYRGGEQLQQARELRIFIESLLPEVIILGGDMNSPYWYAAIRELKKILVDSQGKNNMGTFPSTGLLQGLLKLDYIFHSPNVKCNDTVIYLDGAVASDHRALCSSLALQITQEVDHNESA